MTPNLSLIHNLHFSASIFLSTALLLALFISASTDPYHEVPYSDHCSSIIPRPAMIFEAVPSPFAPLLTGYYTGGHTIINLNISRFINSFSFVTLGVRRTNENGILKVEAGLVFRSHYEMGFDVSKFKTLNFRKPSPYFNQTPMALELKGFWSASSGDVCMVGDGYAHPKPGILVHPKVVLKLSNVRSSSNIGSLVTGTLESLDSSHDSSYFKSISILIFPWLKYQYTLVSGQVGEPLAGGNGIEQGLPFNVLPNKRFCSIFPSSVHQFNPTNAYDLQYSRNCSKAKNCNPLGGVGVDDLPNVVSLKSIECLEHERKVRVLIEFVDGIYGGYRRTFDPYTSLIGEGFWDNKRNLVLFSACRFLNMVESWSDAHIGDCSTRLSLRFPAVLSIKDTYTVVGKIWTDDTENDSVFFGPISFSKSERTILALPGLKYRYTEMDRVSKACQSRKTIKRKAERYPSCYSSDMKFDISIKNSRRLAGWGYAAPISVADNLYQQHRSKRSPTNPVKISYKIGVSLYSEQDHEPDSSGPLVAISVIDEMEITAEGIYDEQTGSLCMVGCRKIATLGKNSFDCEMLLNFQLPPQNPTRNEGYVMGIIESMRSRTDPLFFEPLLLTSAAYNTAKAKQSLSRMNFEIIMVITSTTLTCIFVGFQLYHVKKNPRVLPFISLTMVSILTIGYTLPLVIHLKDLISQSNSSSLVLQATGKWLEGDAAITKIVAMVAFLLRLRLLQQTLSARSKHTNRTSLWSAEKTTLIASLALYVAGALLTFAAKWMITEHILNLGDLKSYAGFMLDGFLLPQILFNVVLDAGTNALTPAFYVGTTLGRLLPYVYDLYRKLNYSEDYEATYIFANRVADFHSVASDFIDPVAGLLFAGVIYLQQRFGGRCILLRSAGTLCCKPI